MPDDLLVLVDVRQVKASELVELDLAALAGE
jgi:hypothetical protein